jgi:hypothetical protein
MQEPQLVRAQMRAPTASFTRIAWGSMRLSTQDPPIRTRVGQFDSALLRYAARLARRVEQGLSAYYSGSDTRGRSCARHISQLDAMFNTASQEPAAPGHLPDPRPATGGVAAKWKALLFMAGVLFLFPLALGPVNWLSARGLLQGRAAWIAANNWGAFVAVLIPTTVAAWCEGQPVGSFGFPWRAGRGRLLAEGVAWGLGAAVLLAGLFHATGVARAHGLTPGAGEAVGSGATWGLAMLGWALLDQSLKRGYLQSTVGRALGFWQTAWLLSVLFTLEKLLAYSNPLQLTAFLVTGLLACLTLRRTGDLWFGLGLQTGLDWSMVFLFGMGHPITSLHPPGALMRVDMQGPVWLSGGEGGFYASALFLGLVAILAWGVQRRFPLPIAPTSLSTVTPSRLGGR